jgi:hypothetical protein
VPAILPDKLRARREDLETVSVAPVRIDVGKVVAEVSKSGSAEERVGDGVCDGVSVAVTLERRLTGKSNAAKDEHPLRRSAIGKAMEVDAEPDALLTHLHASGGG